MGNLFLVAAIVMSAVFYFYFKTKQFRSELPIAKKWYAARASVSLGVLIVTFGINQIVLYQTTITYVVSSVFIALGVITIISSWKRVQHEGKFVKEEQLANNK